MSTRFRAAIFVFGLATLFPIAAHATVTLGPATYEGDGGAEGNPIFPALTAPGSGSASFIGTVNGLPSSASTFVSLAGSPVPAVAFTDSASNAVAAGFAQIDYAMEVLGGPPTPSPVNVDVSAFATVFGSGDGGAGASIGINNNATLQHVALWQACSAASTVCGGLPGSFNVNTTVTLMSNTLYEVIVAVGGGVSKPGGVAGNGPGTGVAKGFADPYFQLASSGGPYSLAFSPGIGNSPLPAVPEPTTWSILLLGMGLVGAALRRRGGERPRAL
jgi:hypothetical protein